MDYGWDTSDEEGGMAIDLDAKQEEHQQGVGGQTREEMNYDPSEPTDDYDPAEPTIDEMDAPENPGAAFGRPNKPEPEYDPAEPTLSDEEGNGNVNEPKGSGEGWNSSSPAESDNKGLDNYPSSADSSLARDNSSQCAEKSLDNDNGVTQNDSPVRTQKSVSVGTSIGVVDSDDNTQNSLMDDINSDVPEVSFDDSDFVLEKEPLDSQSELKNLSWSKDKGHTGEGGPDRLGTAPEGGSQDLPQSDEERIRSQEEVDSRNEEALVNLFREESDPERIEEMAEQTVRKVKKKAGSKKIKKKGKKLKKGLVKKNQKKHADDVEDQRFVELRRERASGGSIEESELDGDGVRLALNQYEQTSDLDGGQVEELREPGEIVEESRKKSTKKKEKREKKKKKSKREVATIEEGTQGDDDSQKFPSFLAGFFVQDEGDEELDDSAPLSRSLDRPVESFPKAGTKNYRKRHNSGAEDSVKSFDQAEVEREQSPESDHRKKKHDERRQDTREVRQRESRDSRETRHDHRHGTPRDRERGEREKARSDRERERAREKERENREREKEREVVRDRTRRAEVEDRRRRRSRSASRERRRRSASAEKIRRSRSRDRSARHRRNRSKSRERSVERERSKRKQRERSHERETERRTRHHSQSPSRSPHRRSERASSNKENRDDSSRRRRRHARTTEDSETDERENSRRTQRRQRRERDQSRAQSSSSSSSSESTAESNSNVRTHHRRSYRRGHSSDEDASSDVILVEPERIVINLDEEEDPPSRVDITHHNADDDSTKLVDGESIPPPPELSHNARSSALIQINPAELENEEPEGDATPTRDEPTDSQGKPMPETDYDPAHPTEELEEQTTISKSPLILAECPTPGPLMSAPILPPLMSSMGPVIVDSGPVPPDHPPPEEVRPSPPPVPSLSEASDFLPLQSSAFGGGAMRPQMAHLNTQFQQQLPPIVSQQPSPQKQPGHVPFHTAPSGQGQRFPHWTQANGPNPNMMHPNSGPTPAFVSGQRGLLPTPDIPPLFPIDSTRLAPPFVSQLMPQPLPPREPMPLMTSPMRHPMAPLAQLTSLLPGLDRTKMMSLQDDSQGQQQMFKHPVGLISKGPLMSNMMSNNISQTQPSRASRGGRASGEMGESTEVVDMDMSPGEDDCELELPSPTSSEGDRDDRRRRPRKTDSRPNRNANDISRSAPVIQPAAYLKALSKVIEKLAPKGHQVEQVPDKAKSHSKKQRQDVNDDDVPTSAVELTNKEKYLKKLHLQERVIDEVKLAIKPFYSSKKITKEQYKLILRKAVPKVCHSKSGNINPQKIQHLVEAYVNKLSKTSHLPGKKKKGHQPKEAADPKDGPVAPRQNGERPKKLSR